MLRFAEGFDDFATAADVATTAAYVGGEFTTVTAGRTGTGKAVLITEYDADPGSEIVWDIYPCATITTGFCLKVFGGSALGAGITLRNTGIPMFSVIQTGPTLLAFFDSTKQYLDSTTNRLGTALTRGINSYIEVQLTPGNPGTVTVRVDGVTVYHSTTANLTTAATVNEIYLGSDSNGMSIYFDDFYVCDATGPVNNSFLGDTRITSEAPSGDGAETAWTPSTGGTIDFAPHDLTSDTSHPPYVVSSSGQYHLAAAGDWNAFFLPSNGFGFVGGIPGVGAYLTLDTGGNYILSEYAIMSPGNENTGTGWDMQASNDGATWTTLDSQTGITTGWGSSPQNFPVAGAAPFRFFRILFTQAGALAQIQQLYLYQSAAHYPMVETLDGDTSYVTAPAAGLSDTYTFPDLEITIPLIRAVQVRTYARSDAGGPNSIQAIARIGATDYPAPSGPQPVHAVYTGLDFIYETDPASSAAWTPATVNAAEFGQQRTA